MTRFPNLFLVGAPKCGTTSMAYYLGQHPEMFAPVAKGPTFFGPDEPQNNPAKSHPHKKFQYTITEMLEVGELYRWKGNFIGDWNHPAGQVMMEYIAA